MSSKILTILTFMIVGGTAFILDVALLTFFQKTAFSNPILARIPGFFIVTLYTWLLNRRFTFKTKKTASLQEYLNYLSGSFIGILVNWAVFSTVLWTVSLAQTYPIIAVFFGTIFAMVFNFFFYKKLFLEKSAPKHLGS